MEYGKAKAGGQHETEPFGGGQADTTPLSVQHDMGAKYLKTEAMDEAYGMAGAAGCKSDESKIKSFMKQYGW